MTQPKQKIHPQLPTPVTSSIEELENNIIWVAVELYEKKIWPATAWGRIRWLLSSFNPTPQSAKEVTREAKVVFARLLDMFRDYSTAVKATQQYDKTGKPNIHRWDRATEQMMRIIDYIDILLMPQEVEMKPMNGPHHKLIEAITKTRNYIPDTEHEKISEWHKQFKRIKKLLRIFLETTGKPQEVVTQSVDVDELVKKIEDCIVIHSPHWAYSIDYTKLKQLLTQHMQPVKKYNYTQVEQMIYTAYNKNTQKEHDTMVEWAVRFIKLIWLLQEKE